MFRIRHTYENDDLDYIQGWTDEYDEIELKRKNANSLSTNFSYIPIKRDTCVVSKPKPIIIELKLYS